MSSPMARLPTLSLAPNGCLKKWWFRQCCGNAWIDGVPADTDRHNGFLAALEKYPDINVVAEVFTGWDPSVGAQQALDLITTTQVDGIWTSGIDYTWLSSSLPPMLTMYRL